MDGVRAEGSALGIQDAAVGLSLAPSSQRVVVSGILAILLLSSRLLVLQQSVSVWNLTNILSCLVLSLGLFI
jgi:hypothetical protein